LINEGDDMTGRQDYEACTKTRAATPTETVS